MKKYCFFWLFFIAALPLSAHHFLLAGTQKGLYKVHPESVQHILPDIPVRKIIHAEKAWFFLTGQGIIQSEDLIHFNSKNNGLPVKVLKKIGNNGKYFESKPQPLKDLEIHPANPAILITATNSDVFITENGGASWKNLGSVSRVNGIKAVSVVDLPDSKGKMQLTVLMSHAIYGFAWKQPAVSEQWHSISTGLMPGPESDEEISDITVATHLNMQEIYVSQTFIPKLYLLDWKKKCFHAVTLPTDTLGKALCVDGLFAAADTLIGCKNGGLFAVPLLLHPQQLQPIRKTSGLKELELTLHRISEAVLSAWIPKQMNHLGNDLSLSELWLLHENARSTNTAYMQHASGRKGVYMPAHQGRTKEGLQRYFDLLEKNNLDTLVIDMKDDYGFIRYDSQAPCVQDVGAIKPFFTLEELTTQAKKQNIYLVARIVAFKDKQLYRFKRNHFAVKDKNGNPWQGWNTGKTDKEWIEEYWVDPYNEKVWEYIIAIGAELITRGFDEIQFDYIRFPTDGDNLAQAVYPAREKGMDKESALMSFLAYAREKIPAPISIDIYGANGWYRTGARTGQEVELLAEYVDVICPMFYPSHFRQSFLAHAPAKERPYRIYYQGTYRNKVIARNAAIIRPWTQAFYIPVSYDKKFYDEDYVQRQIIGIQDSINEGYTYWNNSGRYKDIRPDGSPLPQ